MSTKIYKVKISDYAKGHFIKIFEKRYGQAWDKTLYAINISISKIYEFLNTSKAEKIHSCDEKHIIKCEFAIAGLGQSPHGSGNRYIVFWDEDSDECEILLLYAKTHVSGANETVWWRKEIKNNFRNISKIFNL